MSYFGKKIIITPGRQQGGKLIPGNATYNTIVKRLSCDINNPPREVSPTYGVKREIHHPSHLQCPILRPYSNRDYRLISSTIPRRLKKAPDPKILTIANFNTKPHANLPNPTYTRALVKPNKLSIKTLGSFLTLLIGLSLYHPQPTEYCDCSQGRDKSKIPPMVKKDDKTASRRGKRYTPKKSADQDNDPLKQVKIKSSMKKG